MTKAIETTTQSLLNASEGALVTSIIAAADSAALETQKQGANVEKRKAAQLAALAKANKKAKDSASDLAPTTKAVHGLPGKSKALVAVLDKIGENGTLSAEDAVLVMSQVLDGKLVKELIDATYEAARESVYRTMNAALAAEGVDFPEHTAADLDVPELGKRFSRQGGGRKDASFDEEALRAILGEEAWAAVTTEEVIPAQTVQVVDNAKLSAYLNAHPAMIEQVRDAVVPGDWKPVRLVIKDIPEEKK